MVKKILKLLWKTTKKKKFLKFAISLVFNLRLALVLVLCFVRFFILKLFPRPIMVDEKSYEKGYFQLETKTFVKV